VRTSGDGQYVLIFDPVKKHFVLHRVDSTFDMNLVSAPWDQNASNLRSQYPQLDPETKPAPPAPQRRPSKSAKNVVAAKTNTKRQKQEKPKKPKPPVREPTPVEEDSDDGLTVEYPDGPPAQQYHYQPTPVFRRNPSEDASDEDAEHESFEEELNQDVDHLKLPSPANNAGGMSDEEIELDLEAELEQALKETENGADESSESEEE
jgi:RNA polymerase II transcription elongation factor